MNSSSFNPAILILLSSLLCPCNHTELPPGWYTCKYIGHTHSAWCTNHLQFLGGFTWFPPCTRSDSSPAVLTMRPLRIQNFVFCVHWLFHLLAHWLTLLQVYLLTVLVISSKIRIATNRLPWFWADIGTIQYYFKYFLYGQVMWKKLLLFQWWLTSWCTL